MIRTFVHASVLIAAATGRHSNVQPLAVAILDDANRISLSSPFLQLEVLPKAIHGRRDPEAAFYRTLFADAPSGPTLSQASAMPWTSPANTTSTAWTPSASPPPTPDSPIRTAFHRPLHGRHDPIHYLYKLLLSHPSLNGVNHRRMAKYPHLSCAFSQVRPEFLPH